MICCLVGKLKCLAIGVDEFLLSCLSYKDSMVYGNWVKSTNTYSIE